jgi:hypothetical protein
MKQIFSDFYAHVLRDRFAQGVIVFAFLLIGVALGLSFALDIISGVEQTAGMYSAAKCE